MAKIAVFSLLNSALWGGSEELWSRMTKQALTEGHEVLVSLMDCTLETEEAQELRRKGVRFFPRSHTEKRLSLCQRIVNKAFRFVYRSRSPLDKILSQRPDVVCFNNPGTFDLLFWPELIESLQKSKIPYALVCMQNKDWISLDDDFRQRARETFIRAGFVAFVSEHNRRLAERQLAQKLANAGLVKNPLNLRDLSPVVFPRQPTCRFACVARLAVWQKGQDLLFEILSLPKWKQREWKCVLYGKGGDEAYLKSLAGYYGIKDRIEFMGHVSDVRDIWKNSHLLVLPSRSEGTPLALLEAMICARPAVVTDVGGNAEWVSEPDRGFIAEAPTLRSFDAALERAWSARTSWEAIGAAAHTYASSRVDRNPGKTLLDLLLSLSRTIQ